MVAVAGAEGLLHLAVVVVVVIFVAVLTFRAALLSRTVAPSPVSQDIHNAEKAWGHCSQA